MALTVPLTPLAAPLPSDDQFAPSHMAMRLAVLPPALVKDPPT